MIYKTPVYIKAKKTKKNNLTIHIFFLHKLKF